jgi:hypothetical protein
MKSVYETCVPRQDIVSGTFNPELFTASLKQVTDRYAGKSVAESPYTDARVMSAKRVGSYFVLMPQWGMLRLPRPKEIHHAPF